ncbi:hypothetical protein JI739_11135 [Ramlibacter sp. AW1]|uniref:Uncharacterized protein n=1 Tax=Ramlibacter aurantiacus TaxID=2801330 RepID=A0A936ZTJ2_9BURK|nr:hypothetical protein [Ramlibacter aurantiacus]MBL0420900.1 hypothetical protein [Ramlibacter aurantiacus]
MTRTAAILAMALGASLAAGCSSWSESRMGAGTRASDVAPRSGPGTVTPSGTAAGTGTGGGAAGAGAAGGASR